MTQYHQGQRFDWYPTPAEGPVVQYALSLASGYFSDNDFTSSRGVSNSQRKDKIEATCIQIISALHGSLNPPGDPQRTLSGSLFLEIEVPTQPSRKALRRCLDPTHTLYQ